MQRFLIRRFLGRVGEIAGRVTRGPVLDAGCGEGFVTGVLRELDPQRWITGLDCSVSALHEMGRRQPGTQRLRGDLEALPFPDQAFELVVATEVLEHLERPDRALRELCRVSGRWVLLSVPWEPFFRGLNLLRAKNVLRLGSDPDHSQHWTRAGFLRFAQQRLRVIEAPWDVFPWTLVLGQVVQGGTEQ